MSGTLKKLVAFLITCIGFTVLFLCLYRNTGQGVWLSLYVTFLTISYHFLMRIAVGEAVTVAFRRRRFPIDSMWFREHRFEPELYRVLKVKRWKKHLVTARPEQFDVRIRTQEELLHYMTQAEVVHEIIMVLSFLPLLLIPVYGAAPVFVLTSVFACGVDALFVMIQRYNRPRVRKLLEKKRKKK